MNQVVADPAVINAFGAAQTAIATQIATAGAVDVAAVATILAPVFGPIGAQHAVATVVAMTTNFFESEQLAAVHAGQAVAAHGSAAAYTASDAAHAAALGDVALKL
ncbi:type VII secretion target [Williamsia sp.]|uniref:type VII secretion target n=1 Tax=Williamsia sp. TaxID=1872085 RepID=UPI001A1E8429|nr:type VII secretion target [Williamsia sp.]MBJ7291456.1 hypothetical protein [Williamsia sp.]